MVRRNQKDVMKKQRQTIVLVLVAVVAAYLIFHYSREPEEQFGGGLDAFAQKLDQVVPKLMKQYQVPGTAVALVHGGRVAWSKGYGLADEAMGTPVTPETVFQVGPLSKPVTAWGVLRLAAQGKLALDAPVERYLTRWHLPPSDFDHAEVTLRRLLNHTAGLSLGGYPGFDPSEKLPTLKESLSGITGGVGDVRVAHLPGTRFRYSGGGYTLLQLIIEEVTGETFSAYMQSAVLAPLGMARSGFEWPPALQAATAYREPGQPLPNYRFTALAAAGLYSTASDLARFVAAGMAGPNREPPGRGLLSPRDVELMFTPTVEMDTSTGLGYGLGYGVRLLPGEIRMVSHSGGNRGWRTRFAALPDRGEGIVILTNSDTGDGLTNDLLRFWSAWAARPAPEADQSLGSEQGEEK